MPKKVPSQYTGRFSIKPKKSTSKLRPPATDSSPQEPEPAPLPASLRDEPVPFHERKRKLGGEKEGKPGNLLSTRDELEKLWDAYSQKFEDEQAGVASRSEQSGLQKVQIREPGTLPGPKEHHPYQDDVLAILRNAWPAPEGAKPDIVRTAQTLASCAASVPDGDVLLLVQNIVRAMQQYASEQLQAIDFLIQTYSKTITLLPKSFIDQDGTDSESTITQLRWLLIEEVNGFDGFLLPNSPGTTGTDDRSNLKFEYSRVSADLNGVLAQIRDWKYQRKMWLIAAATQSRCFALDILRKKNGENIESLIVIGLNRNHARWSKVDMLGACILLRGSAKSLNAGVSTSSIKIFAWKALLDKFLLQDDETWDNDFVIKAHAALALSNLVNGPFDETSEQLFASNEWIF